MKSFITILICFLRMQSSYAQHENIQLPRTDTTKIVIIDDMPKFPTCADVSESGCTQIECRKFLFSKLPYQIFPHQAGEGAPLVLTMLVEIDGSCSDFKVEGEVSEKIKQEIIAIAQTMPRWIPAQRLKQPIKCPMRVPVRIKKKWQ